jgi:two-component system LytT family response regulator
MMLWQKLAQARSKQFPVKILIVDDEPLARERIRQMLKRHSDIESVCEAANGGEAIRLIQDGRPDVVFLDIQMPDMNGFQVLESLGAKMLSQIPALIFVTAYEQHALRAFEHHALDYLLKPFDRERFGDAFHRAKSRIDDKRRSSSEILDLLKTFKADEEHLEWLTIKRDERILLLKVEDINWIEAKGNYLLLRFKDRSEMLRETISNIESKLNPKMFIRIHRSTIVNLHQIKELQVWARGEYRVVMKNGQAFTLSRGYRDHFDSFFRKRALPS